MKISYKGDYALKTVLELALKYDQELATIPGLAKQLDIPRKFLERILIELKNGGFVESKRGKEGGYALAKPPAAIKIGDLVRFIEGPLEPIACVDNCYKGCKDLPRCVYRNIWVRATQAITEIVDSVTLEDLVKQTKTHKETLDYSI